MTFESPRTALEAAVSVAGSQSELARLLGVTQASVWAWLNKMGRIGAEYALPCERATGIPKEYLRPDIYPRDATPAPEAAA